MPKKRDYIAEILDQRSRFSHDGVRWRQFRERNAALIGIAQMLEDGPEKHAADRAEALRYLPIGAVACVEGYFRLLIRDLINSGGVYTERAAKLDEIKLDVRIIARLGGASVTPGELIAHLLPMSSLEDIARHTSLLLDLDLISTVKKTPVTIGRGASKAVMPRLVELLRELYRVRNIFCHEIAVQEKLDFVRAVRLLAAAFTFVHATELIVEGEKAFD